MVRGDGVEAGRLRKTGFSLIFFFGAWRERRATRRVERRGDSTQSQRSSHKLGDSISGGSGIDFVHSHLNFPDEPDEDAGQDSPADAMQDAPNEPERAADASEGPPPPPAPAVPPAAPPPPPADQTATASDSAMESAPAPVESDEEQDDESVPEVPGTTI